MIPVNYPKDKAARQALKQRYVDCIRQVMMQDGRMRLEWMQDEWRKLRRALPMGSHYPVDVRKILKADYRKLLKYYENYKQNGSTHEARLKSIFNYEVLCTMPLRDSLWMPTMSST